MKKIIALLITGVVCLALLSACGSKTYVDGVYHAEFDAPDNYGYTQYLVVTVTNGAVTAMEFDAFDETGARKNESEEYRSQMEDVQGTYPSKYSADLIHQYLEKQDIDKIDVVAGATNASKEFIALFKALQSNMTSGNTTTVYLTRSA